MKNLTEQQLLDNYQKLVDIVENTFEGERKENLLKMYKFFEDRIIVAPASGKPNYHYCFAGGYVEHVLHIVDTAKKLMKVYESIGAVIDFTEEELVFCALHHDLGKVGDLEHEYYLVQEDDWRRKKLNEWFTQNPEMQFMGVTDRALWLLQHFDVKVSQLEWLAIKVSDGMYDDANVQYLKTFKPEHSFQSSLPYLIHWADHMATRAEYTEWKYSEKKTTEKVNKSVTNIKQAVGKQVKEKVETQPSASAKDLFDELFGDK
ncbi:MAG: hypothetical protein CMD43_03095 [Gammaproteobacteria bacterium]|nr:hypothetical protein [Gammaproteobacteria bacterium]